MLAITGSRRLALVRLAIVLLVALFAIAAAISPVLSVKQRQIKRESNQLEDELGQLCRRAAHYKKISQMKELIGTLRRFLESRRGTTTDQTNDSDQQLSIAALTSTLRSALSSSQAAPCLQYANAILDLDEFIGESSNVCSSKHLDKIERYYERHLKAYLATSERAQARKRPGFAAAFRPVNSRLVAIKFFVLYARQVSFRCKFNLLHSLTTVESKKLVSEKDYSMVLPWTSFTNLLCNKIEQQERLAAAQSDARQQQLVDSDPAKYTQQEINQCKAGRALSGISTIHELVEAFESEEDASNEQQQPAQQSVSVDNIAPMGGEHLDSKSALFLVVSPDHMDVVNNMVASCARLRPIYEQTVQPIVRLARLGFDPVFANFDKTCAENKLIQKWFSVTLVCTSMLGLHLAKIDKFKDLEEQFEAKNGSLVIIDEAPLNESETNGFENTLALPKINSSIPDVLFENPLDDELWVNKYGTTKLQRFKESVLKKIFRLFNAEDINDHIVIRKHVHDVNHYLIKVVILAASLWILN